MLILIVACSSPRYTYYFDHQQTPSKSIAPARLTSSQLKENEGLPQPPDDTPILSTEFQAANVRYGSSGKMKTPSRSLVQSQTVPSVTPPISLDDSPASSSMDADLKRSLIFSISGVLALLVSGSAFLLVVGTLSLTIGVIFGIKWFLRR